MDSKLKNMSRSLFKNVIKATARVAFASLGLSVAAHATSLPANHLDLQDHMFMGSDNTEAEFNEVIDRVIDIYAPVVKAHGGNLVVNRLWKDSTVNASATQDTFGNGWRLNMYGGLFRRPEMTVDGFALVLCHELGHHLGGYPYYPDSFTAAWAADEGQADYFATQVCAKRVWANELSDNAKATNTVNSFARKACDGSYSRQSDRNLCYRTANAGIPLATLLGVLQGKDPKSLDYSKMDTKVVNKTNDAHPDAQCRMDTYLMGAVCTANFDAAVIPARKNPGGEHSIDAEKVASRYSCMKASGFKSGLRPNCWFAPLTGR